MTAYRKSQSVSLPPLGGDVRRTEGVKWVGFTVTRARTCESDRKTSTETCQVLVVIHAEDNAVKHG